MAVNLIATARLNTGPYMKGLATLSAGTATLSSVAAASAAKEMDADRRRILTKQQAGQAYVTQARNMAQANQAAAKGGSALAQSLSSQRYLFHDLSRQASRYALGLAAFPAATLIAGAAWERNFASVIRTSDLKDDLANNQTQIDALRDSLVGMAQSMPASFGDITEVATLANQMGIAASETAEFTRAVIMFSESSGVSVDIAATAFGRLKSLVADVGSDYMGLADSILKVGVNSVATEDEIINVTTQISSIAAQAGFTSREMIGLAGAMASVRVPPELSRGVVTRVFGQIDKAVSAGGTGLDTLARISGRTADQFKSQWGTEGASGVLFRDLIRGLQEAGTAARSEIESLGITSVRDVPVLLRLANAADSRGERGGLLTQTMYDAENAAGETQKQYTIMAETVVGKLKILGNNIVAFFDAIGQSGLGMFGDILDNLTTGIRSFTRDLEQPAKILGMFELPFTNAEALGTIASLSLIAAGFLAIAAVGSKVAAGFVAVKQGMAIVRGTQIGASLLGGAATAASMTPVIATAGRATGALNTARGAAGGFFATLRTGASVMNPWVGAVTLAAAAGLVFADNFFEASTSAKQFSTVLAGVEADNVHALGNALRSIDISGTKEWLNSGDFVRSVKPFENGVEGYRAAISGLMDVQKDARGVGGFDLEGSPLTSWIFEMNQFAGRANAGLLDDVEALQLVDDGIQNLVDGGNSDRALNLVRNLVSSADELKYIMGSTEGKAIKELMENTFDTAGIEMTDSALHSFVNGSLKQLSEAMTGFEEGDKVADMLFGGDVEQMGQFANTVDEAAAAFIDFGAAIEAGWTDAEGEQLENFSLANYTQQLTDSMKVQKEWSEDLVAVSEYASVGLIEHLASLGPEAAPLLAALADELGNGVTTSLDTLEEALASKTAGLGNALGEALANRAWIRDAVGDVDLGNALAEELGDDKMTSLYDAAAGVGAETVQQVMQGLARGRIGFDEAMAILMDSQPPLPVEIEFKGEAAERAYEALRQRFVGNDLEVGIEFNAETTVGELREYLDDPALNKLEIDGDLTLEQAYAESRTFQLWAQEQGVDMLLGADASAAHLTLATLTAIANGTVTQMQIDAIGDPAEGKLWQIVALADGTTGFVQIDGETGEVHNDLAMVVDEASGTVAEVPLSGNDVKAIEAITGVKNFAQNSPAWIHVEARTGGAYAQIQGLTGHQGTAWINVETRQVLGSREALNQADGGMVSYYANGGINSKHVAQIAPAGAMRVWAEPETEGEAYIPFARSKRSRSVAILDQVAKRFGYSLSNASNIARFADGGQYMSQVMSRQRFAGVSASGNAPGTTLQVGPVTFERGSDQDQFREFSRHVRRVGRGL